MAINVDTVYQRVQAILNKEQRGFLEPQKFNLYANQVQLDIYEQYFYDLAQFMRIPGNSTEYSDLISIIEQKISLFETEDSSPTFVSPHFQLPSDCYRLGTILYGNIECTPVTKKEYNYIMRSPIGKPDNARPIYYYHKEIVTLINDKSVSKNLLEKILNKFKQNLFIKYI